MSVASLPESEVHVWWTRIDARAQQGRLHGEAALLSPVERGRFRRCRCPEQRHLYVLARALLRRTLSRYANVAPQDWVIVGDALGRPALRAPYPNLPLRFSVSHTPGLAVCAIAYDREVGVDAEDLQRDAPSDDRQLQMADRFFSRQEASSLRALPPAARRELFFAYWTLKESYLKARGVGLRIPPDRCAFSLDAVGRIRCRLGPGVDDDPRRWEFSLSADSRGHLIAVSAERLYGEAVRFVICEEQIGEAGVSRRGGR